MKFLLGFYNILQSILSILQLFAILPHMNLLILAVGKKKSDYDDMIQEYQKRVVAPFSLTIEVTEDAGKLISKIKSDDYVIAMDELGKDFTTVAFSKVIDTHLNNGQKRIVFVIGGAYGLESDIRTRAPLMLRLGSFTLPHELARLVLVEQLYRVTNLLGGGKYHHQ